MVSFILFAFVASITPGPTNILVLSNSSRYGWSAAVPIILGACAGAAVIVVTVGLGVGESLLRYPLLQRAMAGVGVLWLTYLAWQLFSSPAAGIEVDGRAPVKRLGLAGAAALQVVNPKTWMMAVAVVSVFTGQEGDRVLQVLRMAMVFFLIAVPCLGVWACLGIGAARLCRSAHGMKRFNQAMAILLAAAAWWSVLK